MRRPSQQIGSFCEGEGENGTVVGETWRGARPTLPDSLPMIGEAPRHPGLWLAFGNQHLGFTTGPITGEILTALVMGEKPHTPGNPDVDLELGEAIAYR